MTILEGDIKLLASRVMDDVPEGGGGPTGTEIPYGTSNAIFSDVTEADRAGGNVSIRQIHAAVMTPNTDPLMGASMILSDLPTDPNVSVTLAKCDLFARRTVIAASIANYLIQGTTWSGVLLEDHVEGMRSMQILHRPGTPAPTIGRTLVLVYQAGTTGERIQYVRVTKTDTEARTFSYQSSGGYVDFEASVTKVDLSDVLRYAFPGSPPSRDYATAEGKTVVRDTTVADASAYYGASPIVGTVALGDSTLRVSSIYTQLVPSARTESIALDQRPAAQRSLTLATAPRAVQVATAAHTDRIRISQENRGYNYVRILKPFPAAGTAAISFRVLGSWYTATDDGAGRIEGGGATGTVNYANGSIALTLPALPDDGSSVIYAWGERSAFTDRAGQASYRLPEITAKLSKAPAVPGSVVITWTSGGLTKTASANAQGEISGDGTGEVNHASGDVFLRPTAMIDAGGQFAFAYDHSTEITKEVTPTPDAGGFATITLDSVPAARSVCVRWVTVRNVSSTSGGNTAGTSSNKGTNTTTTVVWPNGQPPERIPVSMTRIPLGLVGSSAALVPYMAPGGTRTATGERMYIALDWLIDEQGYYYTAPDVTGVQWSELDVAAGAKAIGSVTYKQWGKHTGMGSNVSAGG